MAIHPTQAALGYDCPLVRRRVIVRGGNKVLGDVVQLDLALTDAATTTNTVAATTSGFVNVVTPASAMLPHGLFGVLEENTNDDQKGYAVFEGFCFAYLIKSSGNIAPGDALCVTTAGTLSPDGALGRKYVAFYCPLDGSTLSSPSTRTLARVWFSGLNGIGTHAG